jgi:hypothetical protein
MTNNRDDITEIVKHHITLTLMTNNCHDITEIAKHRNSNPDDK